MYIDTINKIKFIVPKYRGTTKIKKIIARNPALSFTFVKF